MINSQADRQKSHDKYFLSRFLDKLYPDGNWELTDTEVPDFLFTSRHSTHAIEVTSLDILNVNRDRTGMIQRVLEHVEKHCVHDLSLPMHVNIFLDLPFKSNIEAETLGDNINKWIDEVVAMNDGEPYFNFSTAASKHHTEGPVLPKYVKSIAIICDPRIESIHVSNMGAFWSGHLKPEYLMEVINEAEPKIDILRKQDSQLPAWLVIYTEAEPYDDSDIDVLAAMEVTSGYERIFFFIHLPQMPFCEIKVNPKG
jgi:hypothetical protein